MNGEMLIVWAYKQKRNSNDHRNPNFTHASLSVFVVAEPVRNSFTANPCDYGFDFDVEGTGTSSPFTTSRPAQSLPEVDALEFEAAFHYFIS